MRFVWPAVRNYLCAMANVELVAGSVHVDANLIGKGLGLDPALVQERMRANRITSVCERGVDEDAGRYRLTFFHENRRFRIVIDESGSIVRRSTIDFGERHVPRTLR
jgi:hypothetical protein